MVLSGNVYKIAMVVNYWENSNGGGVAVTNCNLAKQFEKRGHEVHVFFREGSDPSNEQGPMDKKEFEKCAVVYLNRIKPDIIFCQDGWFTQNPAVNYKKANQVKIAVLFHTHYDKPLNFFKRMAYSRINEQFDAKVFVSEWLRNNIQQMAGVDTQRKSEVIHSGIEVQPPAESAVNNFKINHNLVDKKPILCAAGLTALRSKADGAKVLISSIVLLKKKYPNICLLLTRDGPYVDELGTYAVKMGVEGNVVLTQNVSDPLAAIKSCDVYTHISMNESLGLAILEAMALGVPVLASRTGGIPEIVKDNINGLMVAPDVEEVAAAIYKMLSDKTLMDRLVGEGRKTSEQYTWDNTATKFITLFNKLMNGAGQ